MTAFSAKLLRLSLPRSTRASSATTALQQEPELALPAVGETSGRPPQPSPLRREGVNVALRASFECQETPAGPLHVLRRRIESGHAVGAIEVGKAIDASAAMLSLLALTPELSDCSPRRALYLDTETTGFGTGTGNFAFLVGLSWFDPWSRWLELEQIVLRDPSDEPALLERVRQRIQEAELVVTYNGKAFDLPLLRGRCVMTRLPALPPRPHLDLLHVARRVHARRSYKKRLVTLERELLGYHRGADVEGEDIAARYHQFLRSGDESFLDDVVEHNAKDVVTLAALTGLYGQPLQGPAGGDGLPASELASIARVMRRAGALPWAAELADHAVRRGAGRDGLVVRAEIAKARGDKWQALADFEAAGPGSGDPKVRLELAKLYEHFARELGRALALVHQGTGEKSDDARRRRLRLERKIARGVRH